MYIFACSKQRILDFYESQSFALSFRLDAAAASASLSFVTFAIALLAAFPPGEVLNLAWRASACIIDPPDITRYLTFVLYL